MTILGICCYYHDSSAALIIDGKLVAAVQEERFTRVKHDTSFPINAIEFCFESQNLKASDINYVGYYEKPLLKFERILGQHLEMFPNSWKTFLLMVPSWLTEKLRVINTIKKKVGYKGPVLFINHHLAHAASSFLISPFKEAAIVTTDGVGEWTTTSFGKGVDTDIALEKEIRFPHSIGLLYSTITAYLGFSVNNSEYKVMGLSAYGNHNKRTNKYYQRLKSIVDLKTDGSYALKMDYFSYLATNRMPSQKLCELLDGPIRNSKGETTSRHEDIAAAVQMITEDILLKILDHTYRQTRCKNLVMSGGVALNSVANGKILKLTKFKNLWIQPDPGDGGTSVGAAYYIYNTLLKNKRNFVLKNIYLGPSFTHLEIKKFLDNKKIKYHQFPDEQKLLKTTASLIWKNKVVGWFQKGMEWGPRALGARSILSNPCNPKMQEILNLKVKHRERFRPFAPVICYEDTLKYFDADKPVPDTTDFMLMVYPIKKKYHHKIPAVTHVDGSGRLQSIKREQNPLYFDLIKEFGKLSGIPILINTSFNIRGEPIVCSPSDAYKCMMGTGIDYLVMDNFLISREDNLKDQWDSEKIAKD